MKVIGVFPGSVHNGELGPGTKNPYGDQSSWYSAHSVKSSFARPTELDGERYKMRYMRCDFGVKVVVLDDMSVWVSIDGGTIKAKQFLNGSSYGWPKAFLAASLKQIWVGPQPGSSVNASYRVTEDPNDYVGKTFTYQRNVDSNWSSKGITGNVFYSDLAIRCLDNEDAFSVIAPSWTNGFVDPGINSPMNFPSATNVNKGDEATYSSMRSKGYSYIDILTEENATWNEDPEGYYGVLYVTGLCLFNSSEVGNDVGWTTPAPVKIYGLQEVLDYYPWERHNGQTWVSLNRDGGPRSQQNTGLFRHDGTKWQPVSNSESSDPDKQHGFRYNNGWQKSPKSGQGA